MKDSSDSSYKLLHESLTANNNGTSALESTAVVLPTIISLYVLAGIRALQPCSPDIRSNNPADSKFHLEFLIIILPSILCLTVLADHLIWVFVALFIICTYLFFQNNAIESLQTVPNKQRDTFKAVMSDRFDPNRRAFITNFRAITNMLTVLCILAVDFHIFPRRFAKTETFGYSVMDLGVGLFVIANALVTPEAQFKPTGTPFLKTVVQCLPLTVLGVSRLILTNQVEYQEHVTEYGQHWNFFFTLAVIRFVCAVILYFSKRHTGCYIFLTVVLLVSYEILLQCGVQEWILSDTPRIGFVAANREGLASNVGYIALYFGAVSLGRALKKRDSLNAVHNLSLAKKLTFLSIIFWSVTYICEKNLGVSRRLANAGYFFWMMAFTTTVLTCLLIGEFFLLMLKHLNKHSKDEQPNNKSINKYPKKERPNMNVTFVPNLLEAINANGLLFFLLGNVLTGFVNLILKTFHLQALSSFIIIALYMYINCRTVSFLHQKKIRI